VENIRAYVLLAIVIAGSIAFMAIVAPASKNDAGSANISANSIEEDTVDSTSQEDENTAINELSDEEALDLLRDRYSGMVKPVKGTIIVGDKLADVGYSGFDYLIKEWAVLDGTYLNVSHHQENISVEASNGDEIMREVYTVTLTDKAKEEFAEVGTGELLMNASRNNYYDKYCQGAKYEYTYANQDIVIEHVSQENENNATATFHLDYTIPSQILLDLNLASIRPVAPLRGNSCTAEFKKDNDGEWFIVSAPDRIVY
jgi:hypothetical protein